MIQMQVLLASGAPRIVLFKIGAQDVCTLFKLFDGSLNIRTLQKIASGTTGKVHCVLASKKNPSKYVEFIVNMTFCLGLILRGCVISL